VNALVLGIFKYFNFFNDAFGPLVTALGVPYAVCNLSLMLPIGLSFHTFQSMLASVVSNTVATRPPERCTCVFERAAIET
jgi:D-alanyl-lipoteichoic acid acyltransferase DltB (MBOAT superfamily)